MARGSVKRVVSPRTGAISYRARFSFRDPDGTRRHRSQSFRTKQQAEAWVGDRQREADQGTYVDPSPATVGDVAARWLATVERSRAPSTALRYREWYERLVGPRFGDRTLTALRATDIQAFYDALGQRYRGATVAMVHKIVRGLCDYAVTDGILASNPADGRRLPDDRPEPRPVWTAEQARRFLATAARDTSGPLFVVLLTTGLRLGEALALAWTDVDLEARTMQVHRTVQQTADGPRIGATTKTGRGRRVALPATAVLALRRQQAVTGTMDRVFARPDGGVPWSATIRHALDRLCREADVPRLTPHGLRHTCATLLLERGVPPSVAARQLGHSVKLMLERYAQVSAELQDHAADALDDALRHDRNTTTRTTTTGRE